MTGMPMFRVDHFGGYDLLKTDGTFDFDGGSLIVWRDRSRSHLLASYGPATGWMGTWEGDANVRQVQSEPEGP